MCYIDNTYLKLKMYINQHFGKVCTASKQRETSDSFATHFARHYQSQRTEKLTIGEARKKMKVTILWQGNMISCNKSFEKLKSF